MSNEPFYQDSQFTQYVGDATEVIDSLPEHSVDSIMTSPPYFGLRVYDAPVRIFDNHNNCEHEWGENIITGDNRFRGEHSIVGRNKNPEVTLHGKFRSKFCSKCGAWQGVLGSESRPGDYIHHLVQIFDSCKRILKPSGSLWVNIADTRWNAKGSCFNPGGGNTSLQNNKKEAGVFPVQRGNKSDNPNIPVKSMVGIPERFAIAMIDRGWILRNKIIWHKNNCLPSSARDRFTDDYELLFFFTLNGKPLYWINEKTMQCVNKKPAGIHGQENIDWKYIPCPKCTSFESQVKTADCKRCNSTGVVRDSLWDSYDYYFEQQFEPMKYPERLFNPDTSEHKTTTLKDEGNRVTGGLHDGRTQYGNPALGRNMRTVWTINTRGLGKEYKHYAAFPAELCTTPILSTIPEFICSKCGLPKTKVYQKTGELIGEDGYGSRTAEVQGVSVTSSLLTKKVMEKEFSGLSTCSCSASFVPGVILDPFGGTGTTALEARRLGRRAICIDISESYAKMAVKRVTGIPNPFD